MKKISLVVGALALAGCTSIPFVGGDVTVNYSTLEARQMSGCAVGIEVFALGASLQAIPGLMRGDAASLGSTPEEGMTKCLMLLRSLDDTPRPYTEF